VFSQLTTDNLLAVRKNWNQTEGICMSDTFFLLQEI